MKFTEPRSTLWCSIVGHLNKGGGGPLKRQEGDLSGFRRVEAFWKIWEREMKTSTLGCGRSRHEGKEKNVRGECFWWLWRWGRSKTEISARPCVVKSARLCLGCFNLSCASLRWVTPPETKPHDKLTSKRSKSMRPQLQVPPPPPQELNQEKLLFGCRLKFGVKFKRLGA